MRAAQEEFVRSKRLARFEGKACEEGEVEFEKERSWKEKDDALRKQAIDLR